MRLTTKIVLVLISVVAVVGLVCLRLLTYEPPSLKEQDDLYDAGIVDEFDDLSTTKTSKFETKGTITGIEIYLDGQLTGNGVIKIGESDSVIYRDYPVTTGVDIELRSDWYSEACFVTFVPTQPTSGKIRIICNFIGD
jgi:hypothetical protein